MRSFLQDQDLNNWFGSGSGADSRRDPNANFFSVFCSES